MNSRGKHITVPNVAPQCGPALVRSLSRLAGPDPRRCVVLRHDLPDGTWHYDLLLDGATAPAPDDGGVAATDPNRRTLAAFRLEPAATPAHAVALAPGVLLEARGHVAHALQLPDHRAVYLTFEGEISGGRGHVRRIAQGQYTLLAAGPDSMSLDISWGSGVRLALELSRVHEDRWALAPADAKMS